MLHSQDVDGSREQKLQAMIETYEVPLLRMCFVYLRDAALAEDAVQETFLKAYRHLDAFRGDCQEKTWLMRIAINTCKDFRRAAWYRYVDRSVTPELMPDQACENDPLHAALVTEIMRLPRKYMEIVLLYYYQGLTTREIAEATRIPQRTVSARLQRALHLLRAALKGGPAYASLL